MAAALLVAVLAAVACGQVLEQSGFVLDSVTGLGVPYARVSFAGAVASPVYTSNLGQWTVAYTGLSVPQVSSIDHAAYPVWSRGTLPNTTFFLTPLPRVPGSSGMRLSLVWGQTVSDVDIVVVTSCGQVFWNTRLRAIGGVAIRQDNDFTTFNGVENVKFLDHLPCGFYEVYIRVLGKGATFDSRTAKLYRYDDNVDPSTPVEEFSSSSSNGGNTWHVLTLTVSLLSPSSRLRSYTLDRPDRYLSGAPPSTSPLLASCAGDLSFCRTIISAATWLAAPLALLLVLLLAI